MAKSSELRDETLAHYDRMIAWVEKQDLTQDSVSDDMHLRIGEDWYGFSCPLCNSTREVEGLGRSRCELCPVGTYKDGIHTGCYGTPWVHMFKSRTWKGWLRHAKAERRFLAKLSYPDEKEDTEEYCPHCDNVFDVPAYKTGQVVTCPHCGSLTVACSKCSRVGQANACTDCEACKQAEAQQEAKNAENVRG